MEQNIRENGVVVTTQRTAFLHGQRPETSLDDLGRQLVRIHQVRDLMSTASATITTGTSTALIAGISGTFLDLMQISFSNNSTASAQISLKDDGTVHNFQVATGTTVLNFPNGLLQNAKGGAWNIDMEDITGTTVYVNALFSQEV